MKKKPQTKEKALYQKIIDLNDEKINVLILGTSGSGKSTLINALLEEDLAKTGIGFAVTDSIEVYENEKIPFRLIDTVGYEYGFFKQNKIKSELAKFCKEGIKKSELDKLIHMIWFCVDGTAKRIDQVVLDYIKSVMNDWKQVPIIIVFTKSYSEIEVGENIKMAEEAIRTYNSKHKRKPLNIVNIIPVVAKGYPINEDTVVPPRGLDELVTRTNELAPEARRLANEAIKDIDIKLKGQMANSIITAATAAATIVGGAPIPVPDAPTLITIQGVMLRNIAKTYGVNDDSSTNKIVDTILKIGLTTLTGKALLNQLKAIPGVKIAASILSAMVAGIVTFSAGQVSKILFEKVYSGELDRATFDYEKEINELFNQYLPEILKGVEDFVKKHQGNFTVDEVVNYIMTLMREKQKSV